MRFILTEDQLKKLKLKLYLFKTEFLNSYVINGTVRQFDSFIVIEDSPVDAFEDPHMEYDYSDGRLYVNKKVRDVFSAMFGDNKEESNDFFKNWFENKFGVTVEFLA